MRRPQAASVVVVAVAFGNPFPEFRTALELEDM